MTLSDAFSISQTLSSKKKCLLHVHWFLFSGSIFTEHFMLVFDVTQMFTHSYNFFQTDNWVCVLENSDFFMHNVVFW